MKLTTEQKEHIKTYFLIKEGIEITEVTEFHNHLLLKPYGFISFKDNIYTNKQIQQRLYLNNKITDISPLSSLSNLMFLDLQNNKITDLSPLSNLTNLKALHLRNTKITDISPLSSLTNLKELFLYKNNNISKEQIEELKSKLPNCSIYK